MIAKVVQRLNRAEQSEIAENLAYWLARDPADRIAAVEALRSQRDGSTARLQRVARVLERPRR